MRVSRRVDQAVDKLVGFVKNEVARHPDGSSPYSFDNFKVFLKMGEERGCPKVDVEIINTICPRSFSRDTFSLYNSSPWIRPYATSRTIDLMEKSGLLLLEAGIPYDMDLPKSL